MRELPHSQKFGATAGCTLRLIEGCQFAGFERQAERARAKLEKKAEVFIADSWFGSVRAAEAIKTLHADLDGNPAGHEFIGAIKTNHRNFLKQHLEDTMKEWPSGSSLVLECHRPNGVVLLAIGYKYNLRKVLCFVATKDAGTTKLGDPYNAKFPDQHGNVKVQEVDRPAIVSTYFQASNKVDRHNHVRQYLLKLEKLWVTENPWFRIVTTIIGMTVVDAWLLVNHQSKNTGLKKLGIVDFADSMAHDLIHNKATKGRGSIFIPSLMPR
jgi:hypothetical protein